MQLAAVDITIDDLNATSAPPSTVTADGRYNPGGAQVTITLQLFDGMGHLTGSPIYPNLLTENVSIDPSVPSTWNAEFDGVAGGTYQLKAKVSSDGTVVTRFDNITVQ
jgi:hypothetical protein